MATDDLPKLENHPKNERDSSTRGGSNTQHNTAPWERQKHPLYLHHSDQPGAVLVTQQLVEDNYSNWAQSMMMALIIKNKKGLVDGTLKRPIMNEEEQQQWDRCDTLVKTWLLGAMSKDISGSVTHCKHAADMWLELKERFSHTNTIQLFHIENAIHGCEQGTTSVTTFFTKLKGLWDENESLCAFPTCICEAAPEVKKYMETQKTMQFLMGLNESYNIVRNNVIGLDPLPAVNKVYAMALRHEKQSEASSSKGTTVEASAFNIKKFKFPNKTEGEQQRCKICNYTNHSTKNCKAHLRCTYCNGKAHTEETCRRKRNASQLCDWLER